MRLLAEITSADMQVQIMERTSNGARLFLEGGMQHTEVDRAGVAQHGYVHAMAEGFTGARSALVLGVGGGALATLLDRRGAAVTAVDILPEAFDVARRWFFMPASVSCVAADAGDYLTTSAERWDLIGVDAYRNGGIPAHLLLPEFAQALADRLAPMGVIAWNVALEREGFSLAQRVTRLLMETGLPVSVLAGCPAHVGNVIVYAGAGAPSTVRLKSAPKAARNHLFGARLMDGMTALASDTLCALCQDGAPMFDPSDPDRPRQE